MSNSSPNPENNYDPAGSTQMFRAFVDEQPPPAQVQRAQGRSRAGLVIGVIVVLVVIVGVVALAMK
ncbi:hypothetical protein SAMN05216223_105330 [Actinacidiphila yanglinensis]|jgi:hypothetical protein|uniref:Uncharacterized protein n=1 Tax=Actinacidiphila yanglinensis TaxID=310779 RepID=A0A1H6AFN1_9ACTN|nr:hypothetical protein [Actinacidiphila yanglinensis]SEG46566.1 hypothetical protein SAMN05216223_105330 [Actinacidiphila yanglinensis]